MVSRGTLLESLVQLSRSEEEGISATKGDLIKAHAKLRTFELLTCDARFGRWYVGHSEIERSSIERLRHLIAKSEHRIARIDQLISEVLHMQEFT
jgi:hypothetical protein